MKSQQNILNIKSSLKRVKDITKYFYKLVFKNNKFKYTLFLILFLSFYFFTAEIHKNNPRDNIV